MTLLAPRIGNDVSYVTRITDGIHFAWQVQYLVKMDCDSCCSAHCKYVSYVTRINHHSHFAWQVLYFVTLEDDSCCSAHCK